MHDGRRFILSYRLAIEMAPLQVYNSALVFSPAKSIIRNAFSDQLPIWIKSVSIFEKSWSPSLQTLEGHSNAVTAVAFSPDGRLLASGSYDKTVRLWDPATGAPVQTLEGHSNWVAAVAFSPDGRLLASGSHDQTVRLWDPVTGAPVQTLEGHSNWVIAVAFSPDGRLLASGSLDQTVRLWDPATGAPVQTLEGHSDPVAAVAFSPDGRLLASRSLDQTVRLWDPATGAPVQTLEGHSDSVAAVAFSPDGRLLASGSHDQTVRLWDINTHKCIQLFSTEYHPQNLLFNMDGLSLKTDRETFRLSVSFVRHIQTLSSPSSPYSLDTTQHWVTWNSLNILFLPADRRPRDFAVKGNVMAIGHSSGRVTFLEFRPDLNPLGNVGLKGHR